VTGELAPEQQRIVRLLGSKGNGGLLLPEIYREVFRTLHESKGSPPGTLHKIIRAQVSYKEERVRGIWGSWERFCEDVLLGLRDEGFIREEGGLWVPTEKVVPDTQLTVLRHWDGSDRRVRVTFASTWDEGARDAVVKAWQKITEFAQFLDRSPGLPVLIRARDKAAGISAILSAAIKDPSMPVRKEGSGRPRKDGKPVMGGQSDWYRAWVRTAGWHSTDSARLAWNALFPDKYVRNASHCGFRGVLQAYVREGKLERRPGVRTDGKGGGYEYRWTE